MGFLLHPPAQRSRTLPPRRTPATAQATPSSVSDVSPPSTQGRTVVATVHQPRAALFNLLDSVLLLSRARAPCTPNALAPASRGAACACTGRLCTKTQLAVVPSD